jgi:hypothetical protein
MRMRAAAYHLGASIAVAAIAAGLVFLLWYPTPYREISGGRELFLLVVAVDVVIGPLITFAVFDIRKPKSELVRDLGVVALLQIAALAYGLSAVADARPAIVALEGSRLRVVRAIDVDREDLANAPADLRSLSFTGPVFVATRVPDASEKLEAIDRGLSGQDIGMRPEFWLPLEQAAAARTRAAQPLRRLSERFPRRTAEIAAAAALSGRPLEQLGYLPILARRTDWTALVDLKDGSVVGYLPIDGF